MFDLVKDDTETLSMSKKCAKMYRESYTKMTPKTCFNLNSVSQIQVRQRNKRPLQFYGC